MEIKRIHINQPLLGQLETIDKNIIKENSIKVPGFIMKRDDLVGFSSKIHYIEKLTLKPMARMNEKELCDPINNN